MTSWPHPPINCSLQKRVARIVYRVRGNREKKHVSQSTSMCIKCVCVGGGGARHSLDVSKGLNSYFVDVAKTCKSEYILMYNVCVWVWGGGGGETKFECLEGFNLNFLLCRCGKNM